MGDRTRIQCWIPKEIFEARKDDIETIMWDGITLDDDGKFYYCEEDEVNYGGSHETAELLKGEIPFAWQCDEGGSYGAAMSICDGTTLSEIAIDHEDDVFARVTFKDGKPIPIPTDMEQLADFAATVKAFAAKFGVPHRFEAFLK